MDLARFVADCQENIWGNNLECDLARDYLLTHRGLSQATVRHLGLGYCHSGQSLPSAEDGASFYPMMNKIIIPICSEFGDLVGAAARSPDPKVKGWWNTRFVKQHNLFLFNLAKASMFLHDKVYLLEGYMDVIALHQEGLANACGLMGTTLGYRRIGLLKRYCNKVCLCFDSDLNQAGQMAQTRSVYELSRFQFDTISKIELPIGTDPDEFVIQNGLDELLALEVDLSKAEIKHHVELHRKSLQ